LAEAAFLKHEGAGARVLRVVHFARGVFVERRLRFSAALVLAGLGAGLEGVGVAALVPLLNVVNPGQGTSSMMGGLASKVAAFFHVALTLESVMLAMLGLVVAQQAVLLLSAKVAAGLICDYEARLRGRVYSQVFDASWTFFLKQKTGNIVDALTVEAQEAGAALAGVLALASNILVTVAYLVAALLFSWQMTLITILGGAIVVWSLRNRVAMGGRLGGRIAAANSELQGEAMEAVAAAKLIKASAVEGVATERFSGRASVLAHSKYKNIMNEALLASFADPMMFLLLLAGMYVAVRILKLPFAIVIAILFVFFRLAPRITTIQRKLLNVTSSLAALERIEWVEAQSAAMREESGSVSKRDLLDSVRLEHVSFEYDPEHQVLHDVDVEIRRNQVTALVGPSGAGKSTIADLVMALVRPSAGTVWLDDVDARDVSIQEWRGRIGYVTQDASFFHASLRENLTWTAPDADDGSIAEALRVAYADGFVAEMPDGLDTVIGDRGVRVSGGQRQRLALARAILRDPDLLILDEATSALDAESEERIQEAIRQVARDTTVVVITHRLASVKGADRIYFIEDGRVLEQGTWAQLTSAGGRFREMMELQELGVKSEDEALLAVEESEAGPI